MQIVLFIILDKTTSKGNIDRDYTVRDVLNTVRNIEQRFREVESVVKNQNAMDKMQMAHIYYDGAWSASLCLSLSFVVHILVKYWS